jgi:predicted RNA-binding protein associated with RNAse of E/G family
MANSPSIIVIKNDHAGREVWRYQGRILERTERHVTLEAFFARDDMDLGFIVFRKGDRFVETFYADRWYNVFEVHDVEDDRLKGWYCNITRPAVLANSSVRADDLALDLFVYPDGRTLVLDEDEFANLPLSEPERQKAREALDALQVLARAGQPPFQLGGEQP